MSLTAHLSLTETASSSSAAVAAAHLDDLVFAAIVARDGTKDADSTALRHLLVRLGEYALLELRHPITVVADQATMSLVGCLEPPTGGPARRCWDHVRTRPAATPSDHTAITASRRRAAALAAIFERRDAHALEALRPTLRTPDRGPVQYGLVIEPPRPFAPHDWLPEWV